MEQVEYVGYFVLAAGIVISLIFTVTRPMKENTKQMTELTLELKHQREWQTAHEEDFKKQVAKNAEKHKELWAYNDEQDKVIEDHEKRIIKLENKGGD